MQKPSNPRCRACPRPLFQPFDRKGTCASRDIYHVTFDSTTATHRKWKAIGDFQSVSNVQSQQLSGHEVRHGFPTMFRNLQHCSCIQSNALQSATFFFFLGDGCKGQWLSSCHGLVTLRSSNRRKSTRLDPTCVGIFNVYDSTRSPCPFLSRRSFSALGSVFLPAHDRNAAKEGRCTRRHCVVRISSTPQTRIHVSLGGTLNQGVGNLSLGGRS